VWPLPTLPEAAMIEGRGIPSAIHRPASALAVFSPVIPSVILADPPNGLSSFSPPAPAPAAAPLSPFGVEGGTAVAAAAAPESAPSENPAASPNGASSTPFFSSAGLLPSALPRSAPPAAARSAARRVRLPVPFFRRTGAPVAGGGLVAPAEESRGSLAAPAPERAPPVPKGLSSAGLGGGWANWVVRSGEGAGWASVGSQRNGRGRAGGREKENEREREMINHLRAVYSGFSLLLL